MHTRFCGRSAIQLAHPGVVCDQVLDGGGGVGGLTQVSNHTCAHATSSGFELLQDPVMGSAAHSSTRHKGRKQWRGMHTELLGEGVEAGGRGAPEAEHLALRH